MKNTINQFIGSVLVKFYRIKAIPNKNIDINEDKLFFLTGYDKSGTTWMRNALHQINDFSCIGSNQYFDFFDEKPEGVILNTIKNAEERESILNLSAKYFESTFKTDYYNRLVLASKSEASYYGEKSTIQDLNLIAHFFPTSKTIILIRDMRDILVSFAFHFDRKYKNITKNWSRERSKIDENGKIKNDFIEREIQKMKAYYQHIINFENQYQKNLIVVKYEDLISDKGFDYFMKMIKFINNNETEETKIKNAWNKHTFEKLSKGRKPGEKDVTSFYRSGTAKDYLNHLTNEQIDWIERELKDQLSYFNYI